MTECLSAAGPCDTFRVTKTLCDTCRQSVDQTHQQMRLVAINQAIRLLESLGYTVTPPDADPPKG